MKIMHVLPNTATNKGGLEFSAAEIISSATRQNPEQHNVIAILDTASGEDENKLSAKLKHGDNCLYRCNASEDRSVQLTAIYRQEAPDLVVFWLPETTTRIASFLRSITAPLIVRTSTTYDMSDMSHERKCAYRECFDIVRKNGGLVLCNSQANKDWNYRNFSVPLENQKVIVGGVDMQASPSSIPAITRESLGISKDAYVVSNVTRITNKYGVNYRKDPFGFILMASYLSKYYPDAVFLICGEGAKWSNSFIQHVLRKANEMTGGNLTPDTFKAIGHVEEMDGIYKMSNVAVSTAQSESFGRTVVEAMKYGVPSVVTDTGIMPEMNGDISHVIPVRPFSYSDDEAYYGNGEQNLEWLKSVEKQFHALHERAPQKVADDVKYLTQRAHGKYHIDSVALQYAHAYEEIVSPALVTPTPTDGIMKWARRRIDSRCFGFAHESKG